MILFRLTIFSVATEISFSIPNLVGGKLVVLEYKFYYLVMGFRFHLFLYIPRCFWETSKDLPYAGATENRHIFLLQSTEYF